MLSIVDREPLQRAPERSSSDRVVSIDEARPPEAAPDEPLLSEEPVEFEIVLGKRQLASVLFLLTVVFGAFSAVCYLAGKSMTPKPAPAPVVSEPSTVAAPIIATAAMIVRQPEAVQKPTDPKPEAPLFADPQSGALYIQLGAVEKGVAIIMAEGLRKRELGAFVAPGPNDHVFRVLVGPLDADGYKRAKTAVDDLGLSAFARKYQQ